jgi:hypothetical protein
MAVLRIELTGTDALTSRIINEASTVSVSTANVEFATYVTNTITTFFGFLGRIMIPIFVFFVPVGTVLIFQNRNFEKNVIITTLIVMSIPALYAYSIPALDTKYFYFMYPMFCVLSVLAMDKYGKVIEKPHILLMIAIIGIIIGSIVFLAVKIPDKEYELEYYQVAQFIVHNVKGINEYYPESSYISAAQLATVWPSLKSSVDFNTMVIPILDHTELSKYIIDSKEKGLTHVIVDDRENRAVFLNDVFYHEEKYPYLTKVFDSREYHYKIHIKIFKIDYEEFDSILKEK